jgi:tetratricopeptide (TPR) repeat protein
MARLSKSERELWNRLRCEAGRDRAEAAFELASLLGNRRQFQDAEWLLRGVVRRSEGEISISAEAWMRLATVFEEQDKVDLAEVAYGRAAELASPDQTPEVMLDVAAHFEKSGQPDSAQAVYECVFRKAEDRQLGAVAAFRLAKLLRKGGSHDRVVALLRVALVDGSSSNSLHIAMLLADELNRFSPGPGSAEVGEAEPLLQTVMQADHPDLSPQAALTLARLRLRQRQLQEAYRLCQLVIDSAHPGFLDEAHGLQSHLLHLELEGRESESTIPGTPGLLIGPSSPGPPERLKSAPFFPMPPSEHLRVLGRVNLEHERLWVSRLTSDPHPAGDRGRKCPLCVCRSAPLSAPGRRPFGVAIQAALRRVLWGSFPAPLVRAQIHALSVAVHFPETVDCGVGLGLSPARLQSARDQILRELLVKAIESEAFDLQTVRALVAELPLRAGTDDCIEDHVLEPQPRAIDELAVGHRFSFAKETGCSTERGCSSGQQRDLLGSLIPDHLEQLCDLNWEAEIDEELPRTRLLREEKVLVKGKDGDLRHLLLLS